MAKETHSYMVYGVDCKRLGSLYASALMTNAQEKPGNLPALAAHPLYKALKEHERAAVRRNIHTVAKEMLILSGLSPKKVEAVMSTNFS